MMGFAEAWKRAQRQEYSQKKLLQEAGPHKKFISGKMDQFDTEITAVIKELDHAGASVMGVPQSARRKAFEIEQEITEAALDDDMPRFRSALRGWREIWLQSLH